MVLLRANLPIGLNIVILQNQRCYINHTLAYNCFSRRISWLRKSYCRREWGTEWGQLLSLKWIVQRRQWKGTKESDTSESDECQRHRREINQVLPLRTTRWQSLGHCYIITGLQFLSHILSSYSAQEPLTLSGVVVSAVQWALLCSLDTYLRYFRTIPTIMGSNFKKSG